MSDEIEAAETRRHWSTKARLILAGVAVLGVGAAITTAAWTDNVFFEADATSSSFNLQGSVDDGASWAESATDTDITLVIPPAAFANLSQDETRQFTVLVQNTGTLGGNLTAVTVTPTGPIFEGADPALATVAPLAPPDIAIAAADPVSDADEVEFVLTVTTSATWDPAIYGGQNGTITIQVVGQSS